jgi:hypothetical protein
MVAQLRNPSYSVGKDKRIMSLRPPYLKKQDTKQNFKKKNRLEDWRMWLEL